MTEAALFYENEAAGLGVDFLDDVQRTINRLREHPESGHAVTGELRRGLVSRFPFSILYAIEPEYLLIVAVAHQRRKPGYWLSRIKG